ncbi:MAG: hypothetical protein NZM10_00920, partial [Fimbriimonadales bacterium]|nr:hypothetical protein [Fimbriimonadales bacterium]
VEALISPSKIKSSPNALAGRGNRARTGEVTSPVRRILCLPLKRDDFKLEALTNRLSKCRDIVGEDADTT